MSPNDRELNLEEIDALLAGDEEDSADEYFGEDVEEDSDDFDALLAGDEDSEEDSLEEMLGAIDASYLSEKEQVFLQNKSFLESNNPTQLDAFFMDFQETLYGAMDDYFGQDEFGAEDELDDMELEVDLMDGHAFGSDEEAIEFVEEAAINGECMGLEEEFGALINPKRRAARVAKRRIAGRKAKNWAKKNKKKIRKAAATTALAVTSPVGTAVAAGMATKAVRDNMKTRNNYLRQLKQLEKCVKRFDKKAKKVSPAVAIKIVAGKGAFMKRPFSVMAASSEQELKTVSAAIEGRKLNLKDRRLVKLAERCDERYNKLRSIWRALKAKGKTAGLVAPSAVFNDIMAQYTSVAKSESKKHGGAIAAAVVATAAVAKKPRKALVSAIKKGAFKPVKRTKRLIGLGKKAVQSLTPAEVKAAKEAKRESAKELAAARKASRRETLKAARVLRKKKLAAARSAISKKLKAASIRRKSLREEKAANASMVAKNPYMDEADLKALNRASEARMVKPKVSLPKTRRPVGKMNKLGRLKVRLKSLEAERNNIMSELEGKPVGSTLHTVLTKKKRELITAVLETKRMIEREERKMSFRSTRRR